MSTYQELLTEARRRLEAQGVPEAALDARYLLEYAAKMTREELLFHQMDVAPNEPAAAYEELLAKREKRVPLQQILGSAWFMGLEFFVNEHVLVPRMDTEILVEEAAKMLQDGMCVLDLCTGSGCVLLSLLTLKREICGVGADLSLEALSVARTNERRLAARGLLKSPPPRWIQSDLFAHVPGRYQVITANPPYIPTADIDGLMPEVQTYEPRMALDGGADGLDFYRRIVCGAKDYLEKDGWLFLEIGCDQGEPVGALLLEEQYQDIRVKKDLAGLDRVVCGQWQR